jgi:hypothetical protein
MEAETLEKMLAEGNQRERPNHSDAVNTGVWKSKEVYCYSYVNYT